MSLSIIIVHYKSPELLKLCLDSVWKHLLLRGKNIEVVVIDSQAQSETEEMLLEKFPWIKYAPFKENIGYAVGVNEGIKIAQREHLLILNPDIIITAGAVEKMLDYMKDNPDIGLAGPLLLNFNGQPQNSCFRFYRPMTIAYRRTFLGKTCFGKKELSDFNLCDTDKSRIAFPDWLMGSAMLTKKKTLEKVGLMDERFKLYFEDVDWAKRFWENGYKVVYLPEAVMLHYHIRQSRAGFDFVDMFLRRETRWHIRSAVKYFFKHGFRYKSGLQINQKFKHLNI